MSDSDISWYSSQKNQGVTRRKTKSNEVDFQIPLKNHETRRSHS